MLGRLRFYDAPTAWGLIVGDDGRLYVVRGPSMHEPSPQEGEHVSFEPVRTSNGLRALGVRRMEPKTSLR
jgi:cold shock CspA family protein